MTVGRRAYRLVDDEVSPRTSSTAAFGCAARDRRRRGAGSLLFEINVDGPVAPAPAALYVGNGKAPPSDAATWRRQGTRDQTASFFLDFQSFNQPRPRVLFKWVLVGMEDLTPPPGPEA